MTRLREIPILFRVGDRRRPVHACHDGHERLEEVRTTSQEIEDRGVVEQLGVEREPVTARLGRDGVRDDRGVEVDHRPVLPKPPGPRDVSLSSVASSISAVATGRMTSCAILSPGLTRYSFSVTLLRMTPYSPR